MQFIINGVIRSMTQQEKMLELKTLLLGKNMTVNQNNSFLIVDLYMTNYSIIFYGSDDEFEIRKIKKVEIDGKDAMIRISSSNHMYIIPYSQIN